MKPAEWFNMEQVEKTKSLIKDINNVIEKIIPVGYLPNNIHVSYNPTRELEIAKQRLEESVFWLKSNIDRIKKEEYEAYLHNMYEYTEMEIWTKDDISFVDKMKAEGWELYDKNEDGFHYNTLVYKFRRKKADYPEFDNSIYEI